MRRANLAFIVNPLSYEVDGLRALMAQGGASSFGLGRDFAALLAAFFVVAVIATRCIPA
jgi:hypothetical protein